MRFFFNAFFSKCEQIPAHLVIFTNEISNERLQFLCNKYLTTESISNYHKQKLITDSSTKFYYCTYVSIRSSPPVLRKRCSENMFSCMFSCKFAAYFQNNFSWEQPWRAASAWMFWRRLWESSWWAKLLIIHG